MTQVKRPEDGIDDVTDPITDGSRAEGTPTSLIAADIHRIILTPLGRTQPEIPVELWGNLMILGTLGKQICLAVVSAARGMDSVNSTDGSIPNPLAKGTYGVKRMSLVPQLGDDILLFGFRHDPTDFMDGMGKWLLAVDVFAAFKGGHDGDGMGVVRSRDAHRINMGSLKKSVGNLRLG